MSDNASWYQRKMAQVRQQQAPYQVQPQQRYQQPQQQPVYPQQFQQPQLPVVQQMPQQPQPPPQVTIDNLYQAASHWKGGQGARLNPDPCPNCGGNQYFENLMVNKRGPSPAGHCYNCGYNGGMFTQGEATTWGMSA